MSSILRFDEWQDSNGATIFNGAGGVVPSGFTAQETITATDASWDVPALGSPIVKVTVIGGGGGGGGINSTSSGGTGGTTTFNAGAGVLTVSAVGGLGGGPRSNVINTTTGAAAATGGFASGNSGMGVVRRIDSSDTYTGTSGHGGSVQIRYLDLTGVSTVDVEIGSGGTAGPGTWLGGVGGRGEVIVEYVAA